MNLIYAIKSNNKELLAKSSTVGCAHEIAKKVLEKNGIVCGAAYNSDFTGVQHIFVNSIEDYEKRLSGSKYVDSNIGGLFPKVKEKLNFGTLLLFIGTPCQIFFLKKYLNKEYENLITVDILCNSVVDKKVFQSEMQNLKNLYRSNITNINMKDKRYGWNDYSILINFSNGAVFRKKAKDYEYIKNFLSHKTTLKKCNVCSKNIFHCSDITIGDFWNCKNNYSSFYSNMGVGIVSINTAKGQRIFNQLDFEKIPIDYGEITNVNKNGGYKLPFKNTVHIFTFLLDQVNFGQKLQAYAMQKVLLDLGYRPITYWNSMVNKDVSIYSKKLFKDFYVNDLNATHISNFKNYCSRDIFVAGSDQVWNKYAKYSGGLQKYCFSNIKSKNKVSIAVGVVDNHTNKIEHKKDLIKVKNSLLDFKHITVREHGSAEFLKSIGVSSEIMLDPIFLVSSDEWKAFARKPNFKFPENFDLLYEVNVFGKYSKVQNKNPLLNVLELTKTQGIGPREFVWLILHANKIYTNSFHAALYSIIFNKTWEMTKKTLYEKDERFLMLDEIKHSSREKYIMRLKNILNECS